MQTIDVCKKDAGKLWYRKATPLEDGLILKITNTVSSALDSSRNVRFLHTAFDVTGDSFVAGDYQGNIYKFDLHRNRFQLLRKTGSPSTCLAFSLRRKSEFLAALADYSLRCYDTETKEEVAVMKGHGSVIQNVSIHTSGRYALTSSQDEAQLWDLDTFQRKRKLNIKENVGIVNVFFIPLSNTILTCFKDNSIFAWEADTLTCKYQLTVPEGKPANFKALTASRDGRLLVTGGKSRFLHVWALDTRKLLRIVELPSKITTVKQLAFLTGSFDNGSNETLGVLGQDGIMRFINITTCKLVFDVGSLDDRINNVSVSSTGRHIVAVMDSGNVNVYSVAALTQELNRPPPPLVKIVKSNKMADHTCDTTDSKTSTKHTKEKVNSHMQWSADTSTETPLPDGLSLPRLLSILRGYGEYPAKYRMFIWRSVLRLPENVAAFAALADKGTHPAFDSLHTQYPIKSRKLLRVLQRVLSALGHWSPIFGETNYLPMLAFPFVKLFQNNQLVCFEIVATVLENWCQHWFEYFPNPPINILGVVENVLAHHDKELLTHYVRYGVTSQIYAWPVLQTLFSEVLTRDEWLRLFDNIFSNDPSFLLMVAVAYSITNRGPLLKCTELDDFKFFFHHRNAVDVQQIINETYRLMNTTPDDIHPQEVLEDFVPLTRGQYPVFNKYPKFIVDYQVQERERICTEELEYLRQRELSLELQKETEKRLAEEEAWYRQQALLLAAEEKRRHLITDEEQKLADQRTRLTALNREVKMKEMQLLDATRRKFLQFQQMQKETELTRMDDEIRRKALLRDTETEAAMDAADVKSAELTIQRKLLEQEMWRDNADMAHREALDQHTHRLMQEIPMRLNTNNSHADRNMSQQRDIYEKLAKTDNILANISLRKDMELRNREDYEEKDRKLAQLARLDAENERIASQVQQLGASVVKRKENEVSRLSQEKDFDSPKPQPNKPGTLSAQKIVNDLAETQRAMFERIREIRQGVQSSGSPPQHPGGRQHTDRAYLNDTTSTEASTQLSLDRGRDEFEARERELMDGVRRMREKMAQRSRSNKPPTKYQQMA